MRNDQKVVYQFPIEDWILTITIQPAGADMHIEAGKFSSVGTVGTTVTLATAYGATFAGADGDYVPWAFGVSATNSANLVAVAISGQTGSGFTVTPSQTNTVIRWFTIPRTI